MKKLLIALFILISACSFAQTYSRPVNLSIGGVADWTNAGGFIASGTATPTASVATGSIYIDLTDSEKPEMWRYSGSAWLKLSYSGAVDLDFYAGSITASSAALLDLPVYANNTEAASEGLNIGDLYRTASGAVMVTYQE